MSARYEGVIVSLHLRRVARAAGLAAVAMALCLFTPRASAKDAPPATRPEVLVLVFAAQNGVDQVAVTYAGAVGEQKARTDLRALLAATGWPARQIVTDTQRAAPGEPKMTSVSFVAPTVVPYPEGILPVAPLVQAYKQYRSLTLVFHVERPYRFAGPLAFGNHQVAVRLQQSSGVYRYDAQIRDASFTSLALPRIRTTEAQPPPQRGRRSSAPFVLVVLLSVGIAVSAGAMVYFLFAGRMSGTPARDTTQQRRKGVGAGP